MEGLGQKLQQARLARGHTLDEAGRLTKIRPGRLAEIEAEDFSNFASLAYAKGFLQIYGKFLDVDVSPYLEAFETPDQVTVDGYSYLQDNPELPPPRTRPVATVRRRQPRSSGSDNASGRGSLLPFLIGVVVLVVGFSALKFFMDVQRIKPRSEAGGTAASPSTSPASSDRVVAPRAQPVDNGAANARSTPAQAQAQPRSAAPAATTTPAVAVAANTPPPATSEPEVRRAEPVHPEDLSAGSASPSGSATVATVNRVEIRPLRKTYIKVVVDGNSDSPAIERWVSTADSPLRVTGQRVAIRVLDHAAVEIRKNGKKVSDDDADVTVE